LIGALRDNHVGRCSTEAPKPSMAKTRPGTKGKTPAEGNFFEVARQLVKDVQNILGWVSLAENSLKTSPQRARKARTPPASRRVTSPARAHSSLRAARDLGECRTQEPPLGPKYPTSPPHGSRPRQSFPIPRPLLPNSRQKLMPEIPGCIIYFQSSNIWPRDGPGVFYKDEQGGGEWSTRRGALRQC
jgi:hypothetical protein